MNTIKNNKFIFSLFLFLTVIISVQGYFLYDAYGKTNASININTNVKTLNSPRLIDPVIPNKSNKSQKNKPKLIQPDNDLSSKFDSFFNDFVSDFFNPFEEMERMRQKMDHMFQDSIGRFKGNDNYKSFFQDDFYSPDLDIKDDNEKYILRLDLPGMDKSNININLNDRILTITGNRKASHKENKNGQIFRQERFQGQFKRSFTLPGPVDESKMKAEYKNGVLTITVPKASKPKVKKQVKIV